MPHRPLAALCIGHAALDILVEADGWPGPDVKVRLLTMARQGGGPAAAAAVTIRRLGTPARRARRWWTRRARGIPTLRDAGSLRGATRRLFRRVDACIASLVFARDLAGNEEPEDMLRALEAHRPSIVGVTLGARGAVARARGGPTIRVPALPVRVVDTTGAGDAFHGAFAWGLLHRKPLRWTMRFASVVAGLKCRSVGGRAGLPTREEALREVKGGRGRRP
jgi:sugar/nucleoside kinase (ribokinase family)